jgi:hypothetical protein
MTVTPSARSVRSIRQRLAAAWVRSASAIRSPGTERTQATDAAASRFVVWCSPSSGETTACAVPSGSTRSKAGWPSGVVVLLAAVSTSPSVAPKSPEEVK